MNRGPLVWFAACASACLWACSAKPTPTPAPLAAAASASPAANDDERPLPDPLPRIAASVNGQAIPAARVVAVAEGALRRGTMKGRTRAYRQVLSELVVRELLLQEAIARGIEADAQGLEQAYNEARVPYKDDAAWAEAIKGEGFTLETYRAELRAKRTVDALIVQEGRETVEPTEAELKEFYDKNPGLFGGDSVRVAQIQLRVANPWSEAAKAQVRTATEQIRRRALSGEDFARLAKEHSSDPRSAGRGGEIEAFTRDQMPAAFAAAAFGLKPGELSEVVETPLGFHVIKLLERIPRDAPPFEVVQDRLRPHVMQTRAQQRLEALTNRLRAKAKVERFL